MIKPTRTGRAFRIIELVPKLSNLELADLVLRWAVCTPPIKSRDLRGVYRTLCMNVVSFVGQRVIVHAFVSSAPLV